MKLPLASINSLSPSDFVTTFGGIFEHSPWVAERAATLRPFASVSALHQAMVDIVTTSAPEEKMALIRAHPDLVGRLARENRLTPDSTSEQASAGLTTLAPDEISRFESYNQQYQSTFGFPFIICARENKKDAILTAFPLRLQNPRDAEITAALSEIAKIAWHRLSAKVE